MSRIIQNLMLIAFVILSVCQQIFAQTDNQDLIQRGLNYSYNFQLKKAETVFQQIINANKKCPTGYFYKSSLYLWRYLGNMEPECYEHFFSLSRMTESNAEKMLREKDDDENALYIMGMNYGVKALIYLKTEKYLESVWAVKNALKYLNLSIKYYPHNYDAHLGLGIIEYSLSQVPGVYRWTLNLAGLSGSRERAINHLQIAYSKGKYSRVESAFYLAQVLASSYLRINDSYPYITELMNQYPDNSLFRYSYAAILLKRGKPREAEPYLKSIIKQKNPEFRQITAQAYLLLGELHFMQNKFSKCIYFYQEFIKKTVEHESIGYAYYKIGLANEILNKRKEAQSAFLMCRNRSADAESDTYAKRKSEIYFNRTISGNEIEVIKAVCLLESGKAGQSYNLLKRTIPRIKSQWLGAESYLYLSVCAIEMNRPHEAVEYAEKAILLNSYSEKWIKPFAYFFAARAYTRLGKKQAAEKYLETASGFNEFDYQNKLNDMIESLKSFLRQ